MKFKVDDIVVITESELPYLTKGKKAQIVEVGAYRPDCVYLVKELENPYRNKTWYIFETHMELAVEEQAINEQTIMFWNLQLQFMEMDSHSLRAMFKLPGFMVSYTINSHTEKILPLVYSDVTDPLTEDEHNCLATHLALQLSGLGDV